MFNDFYHLSTDPFGETPDTKFYFNSHIHQQALNKIQHMIDVRKGFALLLGEVGTGKTLLSRCLIRSWMYHADTALILSPNLEGEELLDALVEEYCIDLRDFPNESRSYDLLSAFFLNNAKRKRRTILFIDEAQNLSDSALETIRLLSNLECERYKLLQIILIGQPEFEDRLSTFELRALQQRISVRGHLQPLPKLETQKYIRHRIEVVKGENYIKFTPAALGLIHRISGGTPRVINILCQLILEYGMYERIRLITPKFIKMILKKNDLRYLRRQNRSSLLARAFS